MTYAGGAAVTAKGLCYGTSENPTTNDNTVAGGTGIGAFNGELTGLISNTTYYVRAYATNSVGTNYGEQRTFTTLPYLTPTVEAVDPTDISYYSFTCGGNVTDSGTYAVTARGLCWATTPEPTVSTTVVARDRDEDYSMPAADRELNSNFAANKGKLPLPISGSYKLVRGFGPYSPEGLRHVTLVSNGWHLKGKPGAKAQSIFNGVVSGVYLIGDSYVVTVRHGNYISVYTNLRSVSVKKNQKVSTRQALGSLGSDNTMQFQLRNSRTLLNPSGWLRR